MTDIARREMLALSLGAAAAPAIAAQSPPLPTNVPRWPPAEAIALWPGLPPGAGATLPRPTPEITGRPGEYRDIWMRGTSRPDLGIFRAPRPDGRAVLVIPGGGYSFVSLRGEGIDVARALNARGITCFVLNYRLPAEGWTDRANVPLQDAQRAMRLIRTEARRYAIDPTRLGVIGFSAGGHLAASLTALHATEVYRPIDVADRQSARPAFSGLMYAVSNVDPGRSHGGSRANLLGPAPDRAMERRFAIDRRLTAATPPLFIVHAEDDDVVPVLNSLDMLAAARVAGVSVETHILQRGGHGFGTRLPRSMPGSLWPDLFDRWVGGIVARTR
ncbi:alpha/beta hydrolase [Sphingomonas sp. Tas61C01]|uniref:alpha/beta hydrolase n=1 Tax=Sphingomonas sp. Tas61C01 TaxID=3458297 RepID=UPI00403EE99F